MAYVTRAARQDLLDTVADAIDEIGVAVAAVAAAYEQLDEQSADRLEERVFRPLQHAYGVAQRTYAAFARRHGLVARRFEPAAAGLPSQGVRGFLERALDAVAGAEDGLVSLQDSMLPVEVGDPELRAGLADVRERLGVLPERGQAFLRTLGR